MMPRKTNTGQEDDDDEWSGLPTLRSYALHEGAKQSYPADPSHLSEETVTHATERLKGVFWPGMDMFDSATPEMRRMRNQKKAVSVADQLESMSRVIEPTEVKFGADGGFVKARPITGLPASDSSAMEEVGSPPKRQKHAKRRKSCEAMDPDANKRPRKRGRPKSTVSSKARAGINVDVADNALTDGKKPRRSRKRKLDVLPDVDVAAPRLDDVDAVSARLQHALEQSICERKAVTPQSAHFSSAEPWHYGPPVYSHPFPQTPTNNSFAFEPLTPVWDFLGQDFGTGLNNPLYLGEYQPDLVVDDDEPLDEDPERTISPTCSGI